MQEDGETTLSVEVHERDLFDFLKTVDPQSRRADKWFVEVVQTLAENDVTHPNELVGLKTEMLEHVPVGSKQSLIERAVRLANDMAHKEAAPDVDHEPTLDLQALACLQPMKKEKTVVHVNLENEIANMFTSPVHTCCWPDGKVVDELATELKNLREKGIKATFLYTEMRKFLPHWALDMDGDKQQTLNSDDEDVPDNKWFKGLVKVMGGAPKENRSLNFVRWTIAFDYWALAAHATKQCTVTMAMAHKNVCLQVAMRASLKGRRHHLAVIYDEIVRKSWARRSYSETNFAVRNECCKLSEELLRLAEDRYDELDRQFAKGKGKDKGLQRSGSKGFGKNSYEGYNKWYTKRPATDGFFGVGKKRRFDRE